MSDTIIIDGGETIAVQPDACATADCEIVVTVSKNGEPPLVHATTHAAGGTDPLTLTVGQVTGLQAALDAKATPADVTTAVSALVASAPAALDTLNELAAALGNDASFSTTVTNALAGKAPIASPTFTGTVSGVTKTMVSLGNVDNTSDASKPVSTAQAAADAAVASAAAADATSKANAAQAAAVQRANHTGTQAISTVDGLQDALDGKVSTSDARLTDAREWTASTVTQAEAEAGTATTRRAFTAQRVFQAIAAWWSGVSVPWNKLTSVPSTFTPSSHAHGNLTNDGQIGTTSGQIVVTGTAGALTTAATLGTSNIADGAITAAKLASNQTVSFSSVSAGSLAAGAGGISTTLGTLSVKNIAAANVFNVSSAGVVTVGTWQGTAVAVAYGGTGATDAATARTNLGVSYGSTAGTVCEGNDSRLSDTRTPTDGSVTDAKIASGGLSTASLNWAAIQPWAANTAYAKGDLVSNAGIAYRRSAAGTSGATFNTANWQQITPSEFLASQITSGTLATARLGSGTADATTFLRGDQTYASPVTSINSATGAVTLPTMAQFTPTASTASGATKTDYAGYAYWEWTIPSAAQYAIVELQAAGAGGGSGRRGAAGSARGGGGGGGAGPFRRVVWRVADLPSRNIGIQLAAGGAGGASVTTDDTNGNPGSQPAAQSLVQLAGSPYTVLLRAGTPGNGGGGTTSGGSGGNGLQSSSSDPYGGSPGGAGGVGAAGTAGTVGICETSSGGGGGGGLDASNTTRAGGASGGSPWIGQTSGATAGTAGGGSGANGSTFGASICATGGAGGGSATAAAGGSGGNGGRGAGGGGGGASANGFASGAGGNGGDAVCRIILF